MACFLVPVTEAIVVAVVAKVIGKKEKRVKYIGAGTERADGSAEKLPFSKKLGWLSNLLWGGSALLAFEHIWHGEVVPWFPFLTAAANPADAAEMLREMATVGVAMALLVTAAWLGIVAVTSIIAKRAKKAADMLKNGEGAL